MIKWIYFKSQLMQLTVQQRKIIKPKNQFLFHQRKQRYFYQCESNRSKMISSRVSNRSSLASRITKSEISIKKVVSSSQYLQMCKANDHKPEEIVYDSLLNYEKHISIMKGTLLIAEAINNHHRKKITFTKIHESALNVPLPIETLSQEEESYIKPTYLTEKAKQCQQLAELLEERQQNQRRAQEEFLKAITQQYQQDNLKCLEAAVNIERVLNRKVFKVEQVAFTEIKRKAFPQKPSLSTIKNVLTSSFMMLNIKMKQTKEHVFRTLLKQFGLDSIVDQIDANMKLKGRALMALKEYPRLNLKRAFWRWYLSSTDNGDKLFMNAADKLVLYTNINKTTFFYRLLNQVKVRQIKVDPKVKRMTVMFYLYTKMYYERPMREFFQKFKIVTSKRQEEETLRQNIVKCAQLREKDLFKKWIKSVKEHREKESQKKKMYDGFAKRLIQVSNQKKKWLLQEWKHLAQKQAKNNQIKMKALKKMIMNKASGVVRAFNKFKEVPGREKWVSYNWSNQTVLKFYRGLERFTERTVKRALKSFKNEFEEGQAQKKRAVIQLIQCTQGGQKKLFSRWKLLSEKTKLMDECRQMNNLFQTLFFVIKSTADMAFMENKETVLKEKALLQLFKNLSGNVSDTFRKWRELNTISKLRDSVSQKQKEMVLKVLDGLLRNSKTAQIRDAISKFRTNRRVTEIQRSFLKRLLMSKAGMVVIAFRKMQSLPERKNMEAFKKATKFEKGLANFAQRTLKRALDSFRNEFEEGQAQKKRAVIQLIQCTQGGQKKLFNRWVHEVSTHKLYTRCQLLQQFFQNSNNALNRNISYLYQSRSYSLHSVQTLHKYFTKINSSTNENLSFTLDQLKKNSVQRRVNKWFYKAAVIFAVRTRISMQKSLWRLKLNAYTNGVLYDASLMVKLKKMYNNIRKYYELNLFRAFLMIDKYGKTVQSLENSQSISRHTSDFVKIQGSFREESNLFDTTSNNEMESFKQDQIFLANQKAAVGICENIFNQKVSDQLKKLKYNTQPHKQHEQTSRQLQSELPDTYAFLNQSKGVSIMVEKIRSKKLRDLAYGFRTLIQFGLKSKKDNELDQNVEQRLEMINQQNKLMEEVKEYKKENEQLVQEMEQKEGLLVQANQAVAVLSLRINFMITSQFTGIVEKVMDNVNWRHLNQGFDGVIEKANQNFQLEQQQQIYEEQQYEG